MIFWRLLLTGVLSALKTSAMFSGKPFEWVLSFPARIFILPTPVMSIFNFFSVTFQNFRCYVVHLGGGVTVMNSHCHPLRWLKKYFCVEHFLILSLSVFIKMYDVPIEMSGWVWRSLHIMSYPKDGAPYLDECIIYCVNLNSSEV